LRGLGIHGECRVFSGVFAGGYPTAPNAPENEPGLKRSLQALHPTSGPLPDSRFGKRLATQQLTRRAGVPPDISAFFRR
jgi:hypothetical protein